MKCLVEGTQLEMLSLKEVGIFVDVIGCFGRRPEEEWVFSCVLSKITCQKGSIDLSEMDLLIFVNEVVLSSSDKVLGVRSCEEERTFSNTTDVLLVEMVLGLLFHIINT